MDTPISINASIDDEEDIMPLLLDDSSAESGDSSISTISNNKDLGGILGEKTISQWASFIFIVNQIYGPGVLSISIGFQQSGWVLTMVSLTLFLIVSCLASTLLCEAVSLIPGNRQFDKHIEYSGAVRYYFGKRYYFIFQILNNLCLQAYNIASIVICAQSLDQFFIFIFGKTFALQMHPSFRFVECLDADELYSTGVVCISLGYLIICAMSIPTSIMNLNDNVKIVQTISFIFLFVLIGEFIVQYFMNGLVVDRVPAFGKSYYQLVSIFVFSWAFPMFIVSWCNEKTNEVSVNRAVWYSGLFSWFGYLVIGLLGAMAYQSLGSDNILNLMGQLSSPAVTRVASFLFSLGVIMPGIPICLITTRYNLTHICGKQASYFWGVIAPWLVAFVFCQKEVFADLLNWSSLILNSLVNFIIPFVLYLKATDPNQSPSNAYDPRQPSTVQPYPKRLEKHSRLLTWIILISVIVVSLIQIIYDIIETTQGKNPLN
ncbi:hypothetical protein DLAC_10639 [Tieghemostelium lacteum]|uniref:Amino acid transporter transmembrane domain-containing protein n=1 Tax=Tieghemostelium lacteum TaxID=361077 RepID=A0A151Z4J2_TIELA|nr:hypothetical protein DLAC_10639 [Tieghemostelium lacteum]|eukprot:KYQ88837.1 hypothetical protein DLAC_10639 [Tieghemostelium lacteum]